jgi:hypothetical protein
MSSILFACEQKSEEIPTMRLNFRSHCKNAELSELYYRGSFTGFGVTQNISISREEVVIFDQSVIRHIEEGLSYGEQFSFLIIKPNLKECEVFHAE